MTPGAAPVSSSSSSGNGSSALSLPSWHQSSSSNVGRLLGRSSAQPQSTATEADRLRALSASPRPFTEQCRSTTADDAAGADLSGDQLPASNRWSEGGQQSLPGTAPANGQGEHAQGRSAQALQDSLPADQGPSDSGVALHDQQGWQELAWRGNQQATQDIKPAGSSKMNRLWQDLSPSVHFQEGTGKMDSLWQASSPPAQTDSSRSKLSLEQSFTSGRLPDQTALQMYSFHASPTHAGLVSSKTSGKGPSSSSDQVGVSSQQAAKRSSLISTRFSAQSTSAAEHRQAILDISQSVRRSSLLTSFPVEQCREQWQQANHQDLLPPLNGRTSRLSSAESIQPYKLQPSLFTDPAALSAPRSATTLQQQQQPEAYFSAQTDIGLSPESQTRHSPVAAALSDDSPWNDQPSMVQLRHQNTWHLPSASPSYTQLQQQQQQPLRQRLSVVHSHPQSQLAFNQLRDWSDTSVSAAEPQLCSPDSESNHNAVVELAPLSAGHCVGSTSAAGFLEV